MYLTKHLLNLFFIYPTYISKLWRVISLKKKICNQARLGSCTMINDHDNGANMYICSLWLECCNSLSLSLSIKVLSSCTHILWILLDPLTFVSFSISTYTSQKLRGWQVPVRRVWGWCWRHCLYPQPWLGRKGLYPCSAHQDSCLVLWRKKKTHTHQINNSDSYSAY